MAISVFPRCFPRLALSGHPFCGILLAFPVLSCFVAFLFLPGLSAPVVRSCWFCFDNIIIVVRLSCNIGSCLLDLFDSVSLLVHVYLLSPCGVSSPRGNVVSRFFSRQPRSKGCFCLPPSCFLGSFRGSRLGSKQAWFWPKTLVFLATWLVVAVVCLRDSCTPTGRAYVHLTMLRWVCVRGRHGRIDLLLRVAQCLSVHNNNVWG